jgi:hypothetical protein
MIQTRKFLGNGMAIRLAIAFVLGLLLGFLGSKIGAGMRNVIPFLLFPLLIGIAGVFTVGARNPHPHLAALGTGLLAWVGTSIYVLIFAARMPLTSCTGGSCGSSNVLMTLLIIYVLVGLVLVTLGALITSAIVRYSRRARRVSL